MPTNILEEERLWKRVQNRKKESIYTHLSYSTTSNNRELEYLLMNYFYVYHRFRVIYKNYDNNIAYTHLNQI